MRRRRRASRPLDRQGARVALAPSPPKPRLADIQIVEKIKEFQVFEILPFDELSAIEVKYDRQIVAIARVRQATAIYTDDAALRNIAALLDLNVVGIADLELPPEKAQVFSRLSCQRKHLGSHRLTRQSAANQSAGQIPC
jgi:hypothetical protein